MNTVAESSSTTTARRRKLRIVPCGLRRGRNVGEDGWREATVDKPVPLGFAFELDETAYETPPERRRPRSFVQAYIFRDRDAFYWDPDKWLEDWQRRQR